MELHGYLSSYGDGLTISTQAMNAKMHQLSMHTDNVAHFGMPGYQGKRPVVTSFVEHLGAHGVDEATNMNVGRLRVSNKPLDFSLADAGYFQKVNPSGTVELTRDGRFKIDADGYMTTLSGQKLLSDDGTELHLPWIPTDLAKDMKVSEHGEVELFNPQTQKMEAIGRFGIVSHDGALVDKPEVKQGYVEDSNVLLQEEFSALVPLRRQFEANRQLFLIQSDSLSRTIQELGRAN